MSERSQAREYVTIGGRRYPLPTPEEDVKLHAAALADPDNPPLTDEELARMRPAKKRGRPTKAVPKEMVTLRLDPEIVEAFRSGGAGWQTRMNDALKRSLARSVRSKTKPASKRGGKTSPRRSKKLQSTGRGR